MACHGKICIDTDGGGWGGGGVGGGFWGFGIMSVMQSQL